MAPPEFLHTAHPSPAQAPWCPRSSGCALALGTVIIGLVAGGIFFPITLDQLFQTPSSFKHGVYSFVFVVLVRLAAANLFMLADHLKKDHVQPNTKEVLTDPSYLTIFLLHSMNSNFFYTIAALSGSLIPIHMLFGFGADRFSALSSRAPSCNEQPNTSAYAQSLLHVTEHLYIPGAPRHSIRNDDRSPRSLLFVSAGHRLTLRHGPEIYARVRFAMMFISVGALTGMPVNGVLLGNGFVWSHAIIFGGLCRCASWLAVRA
ncbi:hypothetical protein K488DRAFT_86479 [Vararia minispora EC-137]|uniref:Uncharacterized protein n=1 Tax=Vararia minispora EC-137 TaxID=1314806 RepID=A0ACB8QJE0_9AGAM|nr:hypothetical protein K488DRAFT_86479 [Vararia minispora EC-137]